MMTRLASVVLLSSLVACAGNTYPDSLRGEIEDRKSDTRWFDQRIAELESRIESLEKRTSDLEERR